MTRIKLCGLSRTGDIEAANTLLPDYIGFVFAPKSRRFVPPEEAAGLRRLLRPEIQAVGVFVNEEPEAVAKLLNEGVIDIAQLHGTEDEVYIRRLRQRGMRSEACTRLRWMSAQALKQRGEKTQGKWRRLCLPCERRINHDKSARTFRRTWGSVYSGDADECSHRTGRGLQLL